MSSDPRHAPTGGGFIGRLKKINLVFTHLNSRVLQCLVTTFRTGLRVQQVLCAGMSYHSRTNEPKGREEWGIEGRQTGEGREKGEGGREEGRGRQQEGRGRRKGETREEE